MVRVRQRKRDIVESFRSGSERRIVTTAGVDVLRDEARAVFERTVVPRDFDAIEIPFPERGDPRLVRFEEPVAG